MTPDDTRHWARQEDEGWSRAMELALTPVVAGVIGYIIDRIAGTVPVFAITFLILASVGTFIKMYYAYDAKMKAHEAEAPWGKAQALAAEKADKAEKADTQAAEQDDARVKAIRPRRDAAADHAAADRAAADHLVNGADHA
jgi:F0F1-type ATP synthase assembly protein I